MAPMAKSAVTLEAETRYFAEGFATVAGLDEVGTGSGAGPCYVAFVVVDATSPVGPDGLNDSKLLTPAQREALVPQIESWAIDWAIGAASAQEIDQHGLTIAQRLAAHRALAALRRSPELVLLDGKRDWLTIPDRGDLLAPDYGLAEAPPVVTMVKADRYCASVAAASVLAKVARDAKMNELALQYPQYEWETNKGYLSSRHLAAIAEFGRSPEHRLSWNLSA